MTYKILIEPSAQLEIENDYDYYLSVSSKVADLFYEDLQHSYHALEINPFYQQRTKNYRALPLKTFPYLLFFEVIERLNVVKILSLFNVHQDPTKYPL
ncbi:MAG: type II toxin-antitoxin system RelE/ParE family toxin [Cytophagales bacterium]